MTKSVFWVAGLTAFASAAVSFAACADTYFNQRPSPSKTQQSTNSQDDASKSASCQDDAILVFDASGSMAGNERLGIGSVVTRIDKVRTAMRKALPVITPYRRLGLITYGPGPYNRCDNIELNLRPTADAAATIQSVVDALVPAGRTPLTAAVEQAAEVLEFRTRPAVVVLLTDGEETCGGAPCELAQRLSRQAKRFTIHVIGYRMKDFSWTGGQSILDTRCLAEKTGGLYIGVESIEELQDALIKTLGCPMTTLAPNQSTVTATRLR